jgi:hypothetical protein
MAVAKPGSEAGNWGVATGRREAQEKAVHRESAADWCHIRTSEMQIITRSYRLSDGLLTQTVVVGRLGFR